MAANGNRYKSSMRDDCAAILVALLKRRRVTFAELAGERGISTRTVRRWIETFSFLLPITVDSGVVILGDDYEFYRHRQIKLEEELEKITGRLKKVSSL